MTSFQLFLFSLTLIVALGCGLVGGIFFAFSNFVMKALARLPAPGGIAAMQSINVVVLNPLFLGIFLGTGVASLFLLIHALLQWPHPGAPWRAAGGLLYFAGNIVVTMSCNVPRNDRLAAIDPAQPGADSAWREYLTSWTRWNHVRTVTALAAAACLTIALVRA